MSVDPNENLEGGSVEPVEASEEDLAAKLAEVEAANAAVAEQRQEEGGKEGPPLDAEGKPDDGFSDGGDEPEADIEGTGDEALSEDDLGIEEEAEGGVNLKGVEFGRNLGTDNPNF